MKMIELTGKNRIVLFPKTSEMQKYHALSRKKKRRLKTEVEMSKTLKEQLFN